MKNLIGEFQWTPPRWLRRLGPLPAFYWLTALTVAALLVYAGVRHKQSKPRPPQVVASADAPALTPVVDGELVPQPLFVDFSVETDPRFAQEAVQSVARLDLVGKPVTEGISLAPSLDGVWTWVSGTRLRFEPAADWPAGQPFTVSYSETLFAPDLRLAATSADFATAPFEAAVDKVEFYQDPVEREVRKVVANLSFSHPVDTDSLANHIDFQIAQASGDAGSAALPLTYELQFGPQRRTAYVHSVPLAIAPTASFVTLTLNEGIAAANGPSRTEQLLSREIRIPDSSSYFQVSGAQALLARNENNEPVQNITLEFTDDVSTEALLRSLRAWILPTSLTLRGEEVTNARWHSPREVTPEVLAQAARTDLVLHPVENGSSRQHSAAIDVPEGAAIYVAVSQGLTSGGNFELAESFDTVLAAPAYPKEVRIAQDGAVLALSGSHQLTLMARGVATVRVEIGRLIDSEINHLASQTGGDITNPYFNSYSFGPENLTERFVRFIDVNASHPRTASFAALDLGELLSGGGQFFVNVQGWDRARKAAVGVSDERFVLITDLGLLVKANADASRDVFVHSIASGKPLVGASVELLGKNGLPVFRRVTGVSGHASFPATRDLEREKTPTVFVVRNGKDTVFLPFARSARRLQYSRFDVGGQYQRQGDAADALRALVFTDRGIYRPGDAANLGIVVKRRDWRPLERLPLLVNVYGPRGQAVLEKRVRLPASGLLEMPFPTAVESPTGNYTATVFLLEERNRRRALGSVSFKVEEFLPDALRIQSTLSGDGGEAWLQPKGLAVTVSLENLFGTPAADRRVTGELRLTPATVRVAGFENFTFDDPLREPGSAVQPVTLRLPDATTDVDGVATLALPLERYSAGIYRLVTELEGFEPGGGRSVTARSSAILSPLPVLVGHHSNSDLTFLHKASDHELQFVAVNPDGKGQTLNDLTLELVEERFVSALVKRENGTWDYQSVRKELPVSSGSFAIDEAGSSLPLATGNAGDFLVRLRGADGLVYSRVRYTVAGDRNLTGNLERNAELKLVTDARSYAPGDTMSLEITAPYAGTGLITIERDRVYAHRWFTADTATTLQTITVPRELEGNAYVNVSFIRALDSPEVHVSPLSYAVAPFAIDHDARHIAVDLDVPERVKPGDTLRIGYETSRPARLLLYGVDEGILQVANYAMPDPLSHFLPKMALQVGTYQMADLILPEYDAWRRQAAPGGGEAGRLAGSNLNPFRRRTDAPVVFWSGVLDASPDGGTWEVTVPDYFNGELRIMAVAVADSSVGRAQQAVTVRGPFVISPNALTAAAPGDEFDVTVGLANSLVGSGPDARVNLTVNPSDNLEIIGDSAVELAVPEGRETRAQFRVRVLDSPGSAELAFNARSGTAEATRSVSLSVRPPVPYLTTVQTGSSDRDPVAVTLQRALYPDLAHQSAAASASPLVLADGLLTYLSDFPHACTEQLVSRSYPQLGFLGSANSAVIEAAIRERFATTVQRLRSRQGPEGGFRFWPGLAVPNDFVSVYVAHYLTDASSLGLPVPRDVLQNALAYLREVAGAEIATLTDARVRAHAIYVLTRNGDITTNALTSLGAQLELKLPDTWRTDIAASYMAASYAMLQQPDAGLPLIRAYELGHRDEMRHDFASTLARDAQHINLVARHFTDDLARLGTDALQSLVDAVLSDRFDTLSAAYTVMALNGYGGGDREALPALRLAAEGSTAPLTAPAVLARAELPVDTAAASIAGGDGKTVFYAVTQRGFDRKAPDAAMSEGIEVFREFLNASGEAVTAARLGDELTVRLRVRSTGRWRTNVAVIDMLPGGFEVQLDSVRGTSPGWTIDYRDVREDRVVVYGAFGSDVREINYRVKLTSAGTFAVPSSYASSMYDRTVRARSEPGRFTVQRQP